MASPNNNSKIEETNVWPLQNLPTLQGGPTLLSVVGGNAFGALLAQVWLVMIYVVAQL